MCAWVGDGDPLFYQFEGPMLRLMTGENYRLLVHGDQRRHLQGEPHGSVPPESLWVYRFYDQAATTFAPAPHEGMLERVWSNLRSRVTADGFDIETAAAGLYDLIMTIRSKAGADKVCVIAHSMGGLVGRAMMQKTCSEEGQMPARAIAARLFTYGTPHGGISFNLPALDWAQQAFGPAGADMFSPGRCTATSPPARRSGTFRDGGESWDPQVVGNDVFDPADIFRLVGTDPKDYGLSRVVVGPKSDGLVRIEHAYVRGAHRAYVHKSHSGSYGEVNSEEGYQNLRRFLFGRWGVSVDLAGLAPFPPDMAQRAPQDRWPAWQADMRLAIRGVSVVMSEQQAAHWCPIQLNEEVSRHVDTPDSPVPLVTTFLPDPAHEAQLAQERHERPTQVRHGGRLRYVLTLRVFQLDERDRILDFTEHLEQVPDWADSLIVDVGPDDTNTGLLAWAAWNGHVAGANDRLDPITEGLPDGDRDPIAFQLADGVHTCGLALPEVARQLPILGPNAYLTIAVTDRLVTKAVPEPAPA